MSTPQPYLDRRVAEMLALLEPAPDGSKWPCGHPKTARNSQAIGSAGIRCRVCRRAITRKSYQKRHSEGV